MGNAMTGTVRAYCDELLLALRVREVSGPRIGEVLAEVQSHVAETGEDPYDAFGPPREYADRVAEVLGVPRAGTWARLVRGLGWADLVGSVVIGLSCYLLADGLWALGAGTPGFLGLPGWLQTVGAAAVVAAAFLRTVRSARRTRATDAVVDPRTGRDMVPLPAGRMALLAVVPVLALAAMFVGGHLAR